jgi:hypothetical protein
VIKPSVWLEKGIQLEQVNGLRLFRFTPKLQSRSDELLAQSKLRSLSPEEQAELDSISELSQIFTYANSVLAAESEWLPKPCENSSPNEPISTANTATHQNV